MFRTKHAVAIALQIVILLAPLTARSAPLMSPPIKVGEYGDNPDLAYNYNSNQYIVVWTTGTQGLRGRFVRAGWTMGNEFEITSVANQSDGSPRVAFDPSRMRYLVVWNRGGYGGHMYGRFIPWNGPDPNLTEFIIGPNVAVYAEAEYSVAYSTTQDEFFVVWVTKYTTPETYFPTVARRVRADGGGFLGNTFFIANHPPDNRSHPDVAYNLARNEYLVATHDYPKVNDNIYGVRVTGTGAVQSEFTIAGWPDDEAMPAVAASPTADQYLVVWDSIRPSSLERGVYARFVSGNGTPGDVKEIVYWGPDYYDKEEIFPEVAWGITDSTLDAPRYLVVYMNQYGNELRAREVFPDGTMFDNFLISDFTSTRHAVAGGRINHLVTWTGAGIYASFVGNTVPKSCFSVEPAQGYSNTDFLFDASCSADATQPESKLQVRWDWNGDDIYETNWSYTKTISHRFTLPPGQSKSVFTVKMQITDGKGETDTTTKDVIVLHSAETAEDFPWELFLPAILKKK